MRLENIEVALGTVSEEGGEELEGRNQESSFHGLVSRVERLETLGRMTLARTCKQLKDLGVKMKEMAAVKSDASAAIGIANRVGVGKVRHIEVNQLWLQEMVSSGKMRIEKVRNEENLADALTKGVNAQGIEMHLGGARVILSNGRHPDAPSIDPKQKN